MMVAINASALMEVSDAAHVAHMRNAAQESAGPRWTPLGSGADAVSGINTYSLSRNPGLGEVGRFRLINDGASSMDVGSQRQVAANLLSAPDLPTDGVVGVWTFRHGPNEVIASPVVYGATQSDVALGLGRFMETAVEARVSDLDYPTFSLRLADGTFLHSN